MSQRSTDTRLLTQIIQHVTREELDADHPLCPHATVEAFERMVLQLNSGNIPSLSTKQRAWAEGVWARLNHEEAAPAA